MNLALGGRFPGTTPNKADFPLSMNVDYIRVYEAGTPTPQLTTSLATASMTADAAAPIRNYYNSLPLKLTWNRVSWAIAYQIQVASNSSFNLSQEYNVILPNTALEATINSLADGTYYWRVRAQNSNCAWGLWNGTERFVLDTP
jgi:hypothetical protein